MDYIDEKPTLKRKVKTFINECVRVLKITRKPDSYEFKTIVKVTGFGMLAIGFMGFVIQLIKSLLF